MNWVIIIMERDYGKRIWNNKSDEDQMIIVAEFLSNYFEAIKYINKISKR